MIMKRKEETLNALSALSDGMADAVERIETKVVRVNGRRRRPASGVVYAPDLVLAASHALEREEDLSVGTHDGRTLEARFVGRDPANDLAVLKVDGLRLDVAKLAEEALLRVGQVALAVGRPGDNVRAAVGIVSAIGGSLRTGRGATLERYIQTDATAYPGFSGGPLVDAEGAMIGVMTSGLARGVTIAVPAGTARRVAQALEEQGYVKRGYLGILSQPVRLPAAQRLRVEGSGGLLVVGVEEDTPAGRAGMLLGDIVVALDGQPVEDTEDLQILLTGDRVGTSVPVQVMRGCELKTLDVTVCQRGERRAR
jgi:S1-C subfamily serine protease